MKKRAQHVADESTRWRGAEKLRALLSPIDALRNDERNARAHDERSYEAVRTSLKKFGQRKPIVVDGDVVIAGNGTLVAARREGWTHIATVDADGLTAEEKRAYALADNRTAELSSWDYGALHLEMQTLQEQMPLLELGWTPAEVKAVERRVGGANAKEQPVLPPSGECFQLGRHRLYCGDSLDPAFRDSVLGGQTVDVSIIDPPFELEDDKWLPLLTDPSIVFGQARQIRRIPEELFRFERVLVKGGRHRSPTVQIGHRHAFVAQCGSVKTLPVVADTFDSVVYIEKEAKHPHEKPVQLVVEHLTHWTARGSGVVVDWFAGSGTSIIACEQAGRTCVAVEYDQQRVQDIVKRWHDWNAKR